MKALFDLLDNSGSPYHGVNHCKDSLLESGFLELNMEEAWSLQLGNSYVTTPSPSVLIAFSIGNGIKYNTDFRIATAHTDQPVLKLKSSPQMWTEKYLKVNVEAYGGLINSTWMDRPLSMAGKVALKSTETFHPIVRFIDVKDPIFIIPNLAIHLNREMNKGVELNNQIDMLPITALLENDMNKEDFLIKYLADKLGVEAEDILDFDLYLYNTDKAQLVGMNKEFISAPKLDNLASVRALVEGIQEKGRDDGINVIALFDNEEIGSRSKQGADSTLLSIVLEKILSGRNYSRAQFLQALAKSFMISVDGAHALHPNHPEKSDPTNKTMLGDGIVLKTSSSQRYVTDSTASAVIIQICQKYGIKLQRQVNRSDVTGGQTLGPIASSYIPILAADMGIPMLAMHSSRELAALSDYEELVAFMKAFFK